MFLALYDEKRGWRIKADYRPVGGELMDICGAVNELVARETVIQMNWSRP